MWWLWLWRQRQRRRQWQTTASPDSAAMVSGPVQRVDASGHTGSRTSASPASYAAIALLYSAHTTLRAAVDFFAAAKI